MNGTPTPQVEALLVVDMQNDFFNHSELRRCRDDLIKHCNHLMDQARRAGAPIFLVRTVHASDRSTWTLNMLQDGEGMTIEGRPGAETVDGLDTEGAVEVIKTRDSAFYATRLADELEARSISSFALCGVSTESCIATTAADAYARDLHVVLVDRATASIDEEQHTLTLRLLETQYRQPVLQPEDVAFVQR